MKLEDLKQGMIIQTRKGSCWEVNDEQQKCFNITGDGSFIQLGELNEDLSHKTLKTRDVMRVSYTTTVEIKRDQ